MPAQARRVNPRLSLLLVSTWLVAACGPKPETEAPAPAPAPTADPDREELAQRLAYLEQELEQARIDAHVPGMAVAVVKDDELIWAKGFGVTDLDSGEPVTAETVFGIGSSTKAFSATLAAMMVDEGKLAWDDPASKHLPGFELRVDGEPGEVATIRDLLAHRTGFSRMGVLWVGNSISRDQILTYAAQAEPVAPFRAEFHYNNVTYMAGSLAAARAAGVEWEELVRARLLEPLHMDHSNVDFAAAEADPKRARGYTWRTDLDQFEPAPPRNTDAIAPAGAIYSSVLDMSNWLRLQLGEGEFEGQRLVSAEALAETHTQQIEITPGVGYGMGWMLREWNGKRVVEHGGNIDGYAASVAMLPEDELGVVVLTNVGMTPLQGAGMNIVFDALLTDAYLPADASTGEDFSRFVGHYVPEMPGFDDNFEVLIKDGKLAVDVPGQTVYLLEPPDPGDEEALREFEATDTVAISFGEGPDGTIQSLFLHQGGMKLELLREGVELEPEVSEAEVRPLLGTYRSDEGKILEVVLHHGRLALDVPGQMVFDLELPDEKGDYHFRANYDFVISFERDEQGEVSKLMLVQPGFSGVFTPQERPETLPSEDLHRKRKSDRRAKALAKAGIVHMRQEIELPSAGVGGVVELWFDADGRMRREGSLGPDGQLGSELGVIHAEGAWAKAFADPPKAKTGVELAQMLLGHPRVLFGDWREHYDQETVLRTITDADGQKRHVVELRVEGLPPTIIHVDAKTGDVVELHEQQVAGNGLRVPTVTKLSDYRKVAGMRLPHRIESRNEHTGRVVVTLVEVETGVAEDPARFVPMP